MFAFTNKRKMEALSLHTSMWLRRVDIAVFSEHTNSLGIPGIHFTKTHRTENSDN